MKYRFVEHKGELFLAVGIGYRSIPKGYRDVYNDHKETECFELVPLVHYSSLTRASMALNTILVPISECDEITDREKLESLIILYGYYGELF